MSRNQNPGGSCVFVFFVFLFSGGRFFTLISVNSMYVIENAH